MGEREEHLCPQSERGEGAERTVIYDSPPMAGGNERLEGGFKKDLRDWGPRHCKSNYL